MTQTIDVTGLPEPIVADLRRLVDTLRGRSAVGNGTGGPPPGETPEEWRRRFTAWVESHSGTEAIADDSRDSIYEGRGE